MIFCWFLLSLCLDMGGRAQKMSTNSRTLRPQFPALKIIRIIFFHFSLWFFPRAIRVVGLTEQQEDWREASGISCWDGCVAVIGLVVARKRLIWVISRISHAAFKDVARTRKTVRRGPYLALFLSTANSSSLQMRHVTKIGNWMSVSFIILQKRPLKLH